MMDLFWTCVQEMWGCNLLISVIGGIISGVISGGLVLAFARSFPSDRDKKHEKNLETITKAFKKHSKGLGGKSKDKPTESADTKNFSHDVNLITPTSFNKLIALEAHCLERKYNQEEINKINVMANEGNETAQWTIGMLLHEGTNIEGDDKTAKYAYAQAAEQGLAEAQNNLAVMYAQGEGADQDILQAYALFIISAENGDETAHENLQKLPNFIEGSLSPMIMKHRDEWRKRIFIKQKKIDLNNGNFQFCMAEVFYKDGELEKAKNHCLLSIRNPTTNDEARQKAKDLLAKIQKG